MLRNIRLGSTESVICRTIFGSVGQISDTMGEVDGTFGVADLLTGLENGVGNHESSRLSQANVFASKNNHAASNKKRIFPAIDHASQIIKGRIGVTRPHGFDESRNDVVVFFTFFIESKKFVLDGRFKIFDIKCFIKMKSRFDKTDGLTSVAISKFGKPLADIIVHLSFEG